MIKLMKSVAKKLSLLIAVFIIIAALCVSVTELLTPVVNKRRPDIETWATNLLQTPVKIDKVALSWHHFHPQITLEDVTVLNKEAAQPILQIRKINIFFAVLQSLWQQKPIPAGIMLSGTAFDVHQTDSGEFEVQGFPDFGNFNKEPYSNEAKFQDVMDWLSSQPLLILQDVTVRYTGIGGLKRVVTIYNLRLVNSGKQHRIYGKAILHQDIPTEITLATEWEGEHAVLSDIKAHVYVYVSGLLLPQWLKNQSWQGFQIQKGLGSVKLWAEWNKGSFEKIQSTLQLYGVELYSQNDKSTHTLNRFSGNIGWKKEGNRQIFAGDDLLIDLPNHLWPVSDFYLSLLPNPEGKLIPDQIRLGYLELTDVQTFLFAFPTFLPDEWTKLLKNLKPTGALENVSIATKGTWNDLSQISFQSDLTRVSVTPFEKYPGFNNLTGTVQWDGALGKVTFNSQRMYLSYPSVFATLLPLDQVTGDVLLQQSENKSWVVTLPDLHVLNDDADIHLAGNLILPPETWAPVADLKGQFTLQKAQHITRYLPLKIFDPDLVKWLQNAFSRGEIESGYAVIKGPLADFPFDAGNGQFEVGGKVKNVDLSFSPDWPKIQNIRGKLVFSGRKMEVIAEQAETLKIPLKNIHAVIPYMGDEKPQELIISGDEVQADFAQGIQYVLASRPLEKKLGKLFRGMTAKGPMKLKLGLMVPLKTPAETQVKGDIKLQNTEIDFVPWHVELNKVNGDIHFTENTTDSQNITGLLFNKPFNLTLKTENVNNDTVVQANVKNNLSTSDLENWLKLPFSKVAKGNADVDLQINVAFDKPIEILLRSNLVGLALALPEPYAKPAAESKDFAAQILVDDKQPLRVRLDYSTLLNVAMILNREKETFNLVGVNLRLGEGIADWPEGQGLYVTGVIDKLDWDTISKLYAGQTGTSNPLPGLPLRDIDIQVSAANLFGQQLSQVRVEVQPDNNGWDVDLTSNEVSGHLELPSKFTSRGQILAQFQRLRLSSVASGKQALSAINVKALPAITFMGSDVSINGIPLGQISFKTLPSGQGLTIQNLRMNSPRIELQANGSWLQSNVTRLQGTASSTRVTEFLTSLGMDAHNLITSKGKLTFNLSWLDAPYQPSLSGLSGSASLELGAGRIVDIDQTSGAKMGIGKMLSIFSLQSIPRRLSFDFSDIFQKGYSFDYVKGDFTLRNGDVYTSNLSSDGPVARVDIDGRIGLKNKDYDFTLNITPYVTSSLPVAATLLTGQPLIGLAAFAVNKVISSQVSRVTTYSYRVTGPWSNPSWQSGRSARR